MIRAAPDLQQAEANYRDYVNALSETGMIAYFQSRKDKFGKYWDGLHRPWPTAEERKTKRGYPWFNKDIPGCRQLANYNQLINDRIWVMVASEIRGNYGEVANIPKRKESRDHGKAYYRRNQAQPNGQAALSPLGRRQDPNDEASTTSASTFSVTLRRLTT